MKAYTKRITAYAEALSAREPAPGGGSAVCAVFCIGVALIEKSIQFSLPESPRLKQYLELAQELRYKVQPFIDLDGEIFARVMRNRGKKRRDYLQECERLIIDVGRSCWQVFSLAKKIKSGIKKGMISDFDIGLDLIRISLKGCLGNLEANKRMFNIDTLYIGTFKDYLKKWRRF